MIAHVLITIWGVGMCIHTLGSRIHDPSFATYDLGFMIYDSRIYDLEIN